MPSMIRAGGVPEHFNFAWHRAETRARWAAGGVEVSWRDYPGGTGAMVEALGRGEIDLAAVLTEGAVAAAARGARLKVISTWVDSALLWGAHVPADHPAQTIDDLRTAVFAVSRRGSGSHLMAEVLAHERGWASPSYALVGDLAGARRALVDGSAEAFLWEKFTTKPIVDRGEWRRVGVVPTPWPAFVLVASEDAIATHGAALDAVPAGLASTLAAIDGTTARAFIAERYGLLPADVAEWQSGTRWRCDRDLAALAAALEPAIDGLVKAGLLPDPPAVEDLCRGRPAPS